MSDEISWNTFNDPETQWETMPTLLIIEFSFFVMAIISLIHAVKNGGNHLLVWHASFVTGTLNHVIFMTVPFLDNVWQAQATVMITPRLPLYICCVYNVFIYFSMISSWRLGFENPIPESTISGILSLLIYYPYDMIGVEHLWWTWHTTDPLSRNRIMNVPIGSSMRILVFSSSFAVVLYICRGKLKLRALTTIIISAMMTTPTAITVLVVLQILSLEQLCLPSVWGFSLSIGISLAVIITSSVLLIDTSKYYKWIEHKCLTKWDPFLGLCLLGYFGLLFALGYFGKPQTFISNGLHQVYGPCNETIVAFNGLIKERNACQNNRPSEWEFCDDKLSIKNVTMKWYKICGTAPNNLRFWNNVLGIISGVSILMFSFFLIYLPIRSHRRPKIKER